MDRIYKTSDDYHDDPAKPGYYNSATRSTTPNYYYNGTLLPADLRAGSGYPWNGSANDVVAAINAGRFLVLHRDHGYINGWGDPGFSTGNFASLTNGNLTPVVYSINCASGLFDNETRNPLNDVWTYSTAMGGAYFSERLLRMAGGAVGVIGDTRNSPTWANSALTRGLIDATWPDLLPAVGANTKIRRLGDILNYAKSYLVGQVGVGQTAGSIGQSSADTDVVLYHVFGDPTMEMWTGYPYWIKLPAYYEVLATLPNGWKLRYLGDGAMITALQDGNPIARGKVIDGEVELHMLGDGSVKPADAAGAIQFVATQEDGLSAPLREGAGVGEITPEKGGGIDKPGFRLTFPPGAVGDDTGVYYEPEAEPASRGRARARRA